MFEYGSYVADDGSYVADDDSDDDDNRDPNWLSQMFESGFIRFIKLKSHKQASWLPQIIQTAIRVFESSFVSIRCWRSLPKWERDNWMNVQPSKHLILINGYTHQGQWLEGNSHLSFKDPFALAECCRNYFNNQILDVAQNLWKHYHFIGSNAIAHLRIADHCNPRSLLTPGKTPEFKPLLYCRLCNQYAIYHEHECNDDSPRNPYDGYPFDAPSTN